MEDKESIMQKLHDISKTFNEVFEQIKKEQESYWNSLSKEDQLKAFCAVSRRIHKGEIEDKGTYRWVLYDVFGFGPESYAQAQMAGYLNIHNAIYSGEHEREVLIAFATKLGVENPEDAVTNFYL